MTAPLTPEEIADAIVQRCAKVYADTTAFRDFDDLCCALTTEITSAIAAAVEAEREACAMVADGEAAQWNNLLIRTSKRAKTSELLAAMGYQGDPQADTVEAQAALTVMQDLAAAIRARTGGK